MEKQRLNFSFEENTEIKILKTFKNMAGGRNQTKIYRV